MHRSVPQDHPEDRRRAARDARRQGSEGEILEFAELKLGDMQALTGSTPLPPGLDFPANFRTQKRVTTDRYFRTQGLDSPF